MTFLELLAVFLKASMLTSGGLQALPLLQDELVFQRGVLTVSDFATAATIGRITPGPNGLFVLTIGYYVAGLWGALAGALGIAIPPFLAIGLVRAHRRVAHQRWVVGLTRGVMASAVGLLSALTYFFALPLLTQPASIGIFAVALAVMLVLKADAIPVLLAGGLAGAGLHLLGVPLA